MIVYVVHCTHPGFAREDPYSSTVLGVYEDKQLADDVAKVRRARVAEIELNYVHAGIADELKIFFGDRYVSHIQN